MPSPSREDFAGEKAVKVLFQKRLGLLGEAKKPPRTLVWEGYLMEKKRGRQPEGRRKWEPRRGGRSVGVDAPDSWRKAAASQGLGPTSRILRATGRRESEDRRAPNGKCIRRRTLCDPDEAVGRGRFSKL